WRRSSIALAMGSGHRKRMPGIDFQQRMISVFLLYGAVWIGVISGIDYKQSYLTLVAGIFLE
ncbi:hypothetical protein, partial [Citrobacter youngae]|uniref:hypothetical protein n=1 Tax=Citrobacter youngae TaxID=133448 RepID=UPI001952F3FD